MKPKVIVVKRPIREPNLKDPELTQLVKLHLTAVANGWKETAQIASKQIERLLVADRKADPQSCETTEEAAEVVR